MLLVAIMGVIYFFCIGRIDYLLFFLLREAYFVNYANDLMYDLVYRLLLRDDIATINFVRHSFHECITFKFYGIKRKESVQRMF